MRARALLLPLAMTRALQPSPAAHRFLLARHGETNFNAEGRIQGTLDASMLTNRGHQQAKGLGAYVAENEAERIAHVWVSPMRRARQTLEAVEAACAAAGVALPAATARDDLREIELHHWRPNRADENRGCGGRLTGWRGPTVFAERIAAPPRGTTRIFQGQSNARSAAPKNSLDGRFPRREGRLKTEIMDDGWAEWKKDPAACLARADLPLIDRGDAAAATWIFSGEKSRRRRNVDTPWRRVAAPPPNYADIQWRQGARIRYVMPNGARPLPDLWKRAVGNWVAIRDGSATAAGATLVVSHGALGRCMVAAALGGSMDTFKSPRYAFDNCECVEVAWEPGAPAASHWRRLHAEKTPWESAAAQKRAAPGYVGSDFAALQGF